MPGTGPGTARGPPAGLALAEHAGTWSPLLGSRRKAEGAVHYNSRGALRAARSPRRHWDARGVPPGRNYRSRGAPRAAAAMERRVAERLRSTLGPLGLEAHAFKVMTSPWRHRDDVTARGAEGARGGEGVPGLRRGREMPESPGVAVPRGAPRPSGAGHDPPEPLRPARVDAQRGVRPARPGTRGKVTAAPTAAPALTAGP